MAKKMHNKRMILRQEASRAEMRISIKQKNIIRRQTNDKGVSNRNKQ